jgi:signal transduction histidine kinase/ActR/RegA family two-component response regulator
MRLAQGGARIGVAARLYCVTAISILSVGTLAGVSIHFATLTESAARRLHTGASSGIERSARLELLLEKHRRIVGSAPAELDRPRLANSRRSLDEVGNQIEALTRHGASDARRDGAGSRANSIAERLAALTALGHGVIDLSEKLAQAQAIELAQGSYDTLARGLQDQISTDRRERFAVAEETIETLLASARALVGWVTVSALAALLLLGSVAFLSARVVLSRRKRITQASTKRAKDNTSTDVPSRDDRDEIGSKARPGEVLPEKAIERLGRKGEVEAVDQQFNAALGNMPHGLCMYDADSRLVMSNQRFCEIYGLPPESIRPGIHFRTVVAMGASLGNYGSRSADEVYRERTAFIARRVRGGFVQSLADGRTILVSHVPLDTGGWLATYEDVTDRRLAEEELRSAKNKAEVADRAKTEFLATMSHEIRTPLNGILGYADLLLNEQDLSEEHRRYLQHIQTAGSMLLTLVNDILDFSKIEAGQIDMDSEPFSPIALVESAVSIVQSSADQKRLAIHLETTGHLPTSVLGAQDRLRQVLVNLLNNAIKFTPRGSVTIALEGRAVDGGFWAARFSVTDTGIGISPDRTARLFERFSQGDGSIRREFGGTGLGLAISKQLIEAMGGQIGVESKSGRGSTFWFSVQLPERESGRPTADPARRSAEAGRSGSILLVDDTEINREVARAALETAGHRVDAVGDGTDAIAAVQTKAYDLVLMDVQMPGMDGLTATRMIRALDHHCSRTPIIAMTANVLPQQVLEFRRAGMDDHIGKPFRRDQLLAVIDSVLASADASPEALPAAAPVLDHGTYSGLLDMMGREGMNRLLDRLMTQLHLGMDGQDLSPAERDRLANDVHGLVSAAGMLGFRALSEACRDLEQACRAGGDLSRSLARFRQARERTIDQIAALREAA